jgi:hypothetical protein
MVHSDAQEASEEAKTAEQETPEGIAIDIQARLTISTTGEIIVHAHVFGATDPREAASFKPLKWCVVNVHRRPRLAVV